MQRRETVRVGHRGIDTEVHRKEKENRKLQLELRTEKEKLNSTIIKYQRELTDMQAVSTPTLPTYTEIHLQKKNIVMKDVFFVAVMIVRWR